MERTEYIIISDRERKDFNCPGYIQRILSSPAGTRIIVRVYSPTDQDSMGTEHCLNVDQVASVDKTVFRKRFDQIIFARKDRENAGENMTLNELGKYIANEHTRNFVNREWFAGINGIRCETKVDGLGQPFHSKRSLMKLPKKPLRNIKSFLLILWSIPNSTRDKIVFLYGGDKMKMDDNSTTVILTALALSFILLLQFIYK